MSSSTSLPSNFQQLRTHDEQLARLGALAERYFPTDPNTSLLKLRQFAELLAQQTAANVGLLTSPEETFYALVDRLQSRELLTREIAQLFGEVRRIGNAANHALEGDHASALAALKIAWQLGVWFHRTFADTDFKSGPFRPPVAPNDESEALQAELAQLRDALASYQATEVQTQERLQRAEEERAIWEQLAQEAEESAAETGRKLAAQQAAAVAQPAATIQGFFAAAKQAASKLQLSEKESRKLIDDQLRRAGWEVDSESLRYAKGTRPEKGKNRAIAEWPTASGPADYVLFCGLTPLGVVEAKRKNVDVADALQQARRYSRDFSPTGSVTLPTGGPWFSRASEPYQIPFVFSTNGRPYLRQLATQSGTWFADVRRPTNLARPLDGWYSPSGLADLLKQNPVESAKQLDATPFRYGFELRPYQQDAIRATENAVASGQRTILLAMATGTGKTKTCIALIYRLLKAQRFRRVLFLVDRSALGEQAANAFKDTRMENLQSFADIFGLKELGDAQPDDETAVHVATIQGMVRRILTPDEDGPALNIDAYDCVVVDECHRGYLLDRELSDTELGFRDEADYISKYRRVLDYFDAVKIGLTATPALHTSEIFGPPVYTYSYREAVIDGFLVDHEPPVQIETELSRQGIGWKVGETVAVYDPSAGNLKSFETPDAIQIEVEGFNRKVITESFNREVCKALAREIDPESAQKTLVFCVNDAHADLVVTLLKAAFAEQYGECDDDAVAKITGSVDKPLERIRRYKNERLPSVAVTVDLLTTGIDVPEICNLVFLRRVNSRILFDQMLGRATRLCGAIGKETFRIFDAVRLYEALQSVTDMQPVAAGPNLTFLKLAAELMGQPGEAEATLARDQFVARLQRKKKRLTENHTDDLTALTGMTPSEFVTFVREASPADLGAFLAARPALAEFLDRAGTGNAAPVFVSEHEDALLSVTHGYGAGQKPTDYLTAFETFLREKRDEIPALVTALTRPRELTRQQLRELSLALDRAGFTEKNLESAWRDATNQELAAGIVGFIRKAALGDALLPFDQRVDRALQTILSSKDWTYPQRQWLQKLAAQTKVNRLVDRAALEDPNILVWREGGGFPRLDKVFDGKLQATLESFNEAVWAVE